MSKSISGAPGGSGPEGFSRISIAVKTVLRGKILRRNLMVALVVGCVLSIVNQFDLVLRGAFTGSLGMKVFFNFLIPFLVSSVSTAINLPSNR